MKRVFDPEFFVHLFCKVFVYYLIPLENCACFINILALLLCLFYQYFGTFTVPVLSIVAQLTVPVLSILFEAIVPVLSILIN
jgi:hypothetical protein